MKSLINKMKVNKCFIARKHRKHKDFSSLPVPDRPHSKEAEPQIVIKFIESETERAGSCEHENVIGNFVNGTEKRRCASKNVPSHAHKKSLFCEEEQKDWVIAKPLQLHDKNSQQVYTLNGNINSTLSIHSLKHDKNPSFNTIGGVNKESKLLQLSRPESGRLSRKQNVPNQLPPRYPQKTSFKFECEGSNPPPYREAQAEMASKMLSLSAKNAAGQRLPSVSKTRQKEELVPIYNGENKGPTAFILQGADVGKRIEGKWLEPGTAKKGRTTYRVCFSMNSKRENMPLLIINFEVEKMGNCNRE